MHSRAYYIVRSIVRAVVHLTIAAGLAWCFYAIWTFAALMQNH